MATSKTSANKHVTKVPNWISWVLLSLSAVLLLFAQSSAWVKNTVFNQTEFKSIAISTIQEQENRDAIASKLVDTALEDRPILKRLAGDRLTALTSGLLASDLGNRVLNGFAERAYSYVIQPNPKDIAIELTAIKNPLQLLTNIAENTGREVQLDASSIPDRVILIRADDTPNVSGIYRTFIWLAPVFWLLTLAGFVGYVLLGKHEYAKRIYYVYGAILIVALVGLSVGPFAPQSIASLVPDVQASLIVQNLVAAFLQPFTMQIWQMVIAATIAVSLFSQRRRIVSAGKTVLDKIK